MNTNIVQLITSQLGGGAINKLSSLLGESPERTQSAVGASVPSLLAGLSNAATTPDGAQRLSNAVSQQDPEIASNFAQTLGAGAGAGSNLLGNLLGGGMLGNLTSALGRFTGMKTTAVGSLFGMLAPLILGHLGKIQRAQGLDASGLANFLGSQKNNIAGSMPSGLANVLGSVPGLGAFTQGQTTRVEEPAHAGAGPTYSGTTYGSSRTEPVTPVTHREEPSPARWLIPLLIAAAALWGLWAWSHRRVQPVEQPYATNYERGYQRPAENPAVATPGVNVAQFTSGLQDSLNTGATTLGGITDATTAEQAGPQITALNDKLASFKGQYDKLPASAKTTVGASVGPTITKLQQLSAKVRGTPGVGDKLQTSLDQLDSNLAGLSATATAPSP